MPVVQSTRFRSLIIEKDNRERAEIKKNERGKEKNYGKTKF